MAWKETTQEKESIKPIIWIRRTPNIISHKVSKLLMENNIKDLGDFNIDNVLKIVKSKSVVKSKFIETCAKYTNTARGKTVFFFKSHYIRNNCFMSVFVSDLSEDDLMKMLPKLLSLKVFW